ncbi:helix-turn-helix transcriptional regulator [Streptomyces sp. AV19]|uniref:helix-turn-helix domain-containing protein n=1 Tax=Streptomyces sp. AV19 TaxID=2793068 RepID=UPI0018FF0D85|nr:helix-turn-helix transcriptional regulator [Streptomyces sp. AV19]MBH1936309.1 helix-turn-helix transcriptional regulator [Streptomyces sp. AV19]MDG4532346.1 helix-turn-helix domain-containing protein [Streptomyces sp. AV19]
MPTGLADNVRKFRRAAGLSQEGLAEAADLSLSTIRKVEQGGDARVETLHAMARALGVTTSALFATEAPKPVVGPEDEANRRYLAELRRALMPAVGLGAPRPARGEPPELSALHRGVQEGHALYWADQYGAVAKRLPLLLESSESAVASAEGAERSQALLARCHVLLLTGKYLTQVRQYDMAYYALAEAIRLARETDRTQLAATGIVGLCWLLLRQDRFDESEEVAATTAAEIEPRLSTATPGQLAVWGELWLRVASATVRNNRPDVAREARRMAGTAASALDTECVAFPDHWGGFGPVTAEMKVVEDLALAGDARAVLRRTDDGLLSAKALRNFGRPTTPNWGRHRLDVARAHILLGSHQDAMDELTQLRRTSGSWLTHQPMARYVMTDILRTRKRTLTQDMRGMASHLGVSG